MIIVTGRGGEVERRGNVGARGLCTVFIEAACSFVGLLPCFTVRNKSCLIDKDVGGLEWLDLYYPMIPRERERNQEPSKLKSFFHPTNQPLLAHNPCRTPSSAVFFFTPHNKHSHV